VFPIVVATTGMGFLKKASLLGTDEHFFVNIPPVRFGRPEAIDEDTASPVALVAEKAQTTEYKSSKEQESHASQDNTCSQKELGKSTIQIVDDTSHEDNPYGFERVYLGAGTRGGRDAYWEFGHPDLPNRHILVFGASGTGKTYLIQALMCELARLGRNTLVVDYTSGFTNSQLEEIVMTRLKPTQHLIKVKPLEVNPFRKQINYIDDMPIEEDPATIAGRVSGVFDEVYQLGDQQRSALYNAIRNGVVAKGEHFDLNDMIDELEGIRAEGGPSASAAASVISKIQPFVDTNPFGRERHGSWERLFKDPESRVHIIQLAGFMKNASRLITEFSLIDLYWYYRSHGNQWNPKIIVLDEIQNLNHKLESPIGQFLTEGRKFGISLILATQTLSNLEKDERDRLFQASHKIFFRPADTEIKAFAQILADSTGLKVEDWVEKLSTLKRGECYSLGYAYNEHTDSLEVNTHFRIRVKPLEERY
jgi:DNA phosphorothioation-dependent restriction protein DptH